MTTVKSEKLKVKSKKITLICPSTKAHGPMMLRPITSQSKEQQWCGIWYDCPKCHSSILIPSEGLKTQLAGHKMKLGKLNNLFEKEAA